MFSTALINDNVNPRILQLRCEQRNSLMANRKNHSILVMLALVLTACASTFEATYDHDRQHDFTNYRTFAWISEHPMVVAEGVGVVNPMLETHVMNAMESGLRAKGFRLVQNPQAADFVVAFTVGSREKIRVRSG